ncbi:hypothetical protein HPB49_026037 [Dermacentor silvarum]|nr:hypothetical protein HPB49_026037 [Dermacentor silvarum]
MSSSTPGVVEAKHEVPGCTRMALEGAAITPVSDAGNQEKPNVRLSVRSDAANKVPKNGLTSSKLSETALTCSEGEVLQQAGIACKRTQFRIVQASAITVHKSQGATYASVVYEYSRTHPQKLVYVALSRCTHLGGLYLTNALGDHSFYHREDNTDRAMTDEFRRLENHRLQTVTGRYLDALRREQRERRRYAFTLVLLNVRSLRAHALDVARNPVLQEVDVLCLTETWNNNKPEGGQGARGEGAIGEQGFAPVVRAHAVDARSRAGGVDVYYRNVQRRGGMVLGSPRGNSPSWCVMVAKARSVAEASDVTDTTARNSP